MPDVQSRWHGYGSWADWLKAQMALMPLLALCGAAALTMADARYMVREDDGKATEQAVEQVKAAVTQVQQAQAVSNQQIHSINTQLDGLRKGQDKIDEKLDRLIERQLPR